MTLLPTFYEIINLKGGPGGSSMGDGGGRLFWVDSAPLKEGRSAPSRLSHNKRGNAKGIDGQERIILHFCGSLVILKLEEWRKKI